MNNKILFFYPGDIEGKNVEHVAASGRVKNLSRIIEKTGYEVILIGTEDVSDPKINIKSGITETKVDGFKTYIIKVNNNKNSFFSDGKLLYKYLERIYQKNPEISKIIFYGTTLRFSRSINKFCKRNQLESISSVNEWGNINTQGKLNFYLQKLGISFVRRNFNKTIVISTLMEKYFRKNKNNITVRVPSVFDISKYSEIVEEYLKNIRKQKYSDTNNSIKFAYAGSIKNQKDYTANFIIALSKLESSLLEKCRFYIYGSTEESLLNALEELGEKKSLDKLTDTLVFKGFYPHEELIEELYKLDFMVLLRPDLPYANAGFPTKFGESLTLGLPVFANITSDLDLFMKDGINSIVVESEKVSDIVRSLEDIIGKFEYPNYEMKINAFDTGKKFFDLNNYVESMTLFLGKSNEK